MCNNYLGISMSVPRKVYGRMLIERVNINVMLMIDYEEKLQIIVSVLDLVCRRRKIKVYVMRSSYWKK